MEVGAEMTEKNPFVGVASYRTASLPARPTLPGLKFYKGIASIVWGSNRLAVKGRYDGEAWIDYSLRVVRLAEACGCPVTVEGLEHVDSLTGPAVFVANHMSTLETFALPCILRPRGLLTFVVKQSLIDYPLFGPVLRACEPIAVGRKNPREDLSVVMNEGAERLSRGFSIVIFPQTTRTDAFDPTKFNTIGAKLAARAKVELVPLALRTSMWGTGKILKDFGPIDPGKPVNFSFGAPIPPEGKGDAAHRATVDFITEAFRRWEGSSSPG